MKNYEVGANDVLELLRTGKMEVMDQHGEYFIIVQEGKEQ